MRVEMAAMKRDAEHYSRQVTSLTIQLYNFLFLGHCTRVSVIYY